MGRDPQSGIPALGIPGLIALDVAECVTINLLLIYCWVRQWKNFDSDQYLMQLHKKSGGLPFWTTLCIKCCCWSEWWIVVRLEIVILLLTSIHVVLSFACYFSEILISLWAYVCLLHTYAEIYFHSTILVNVCRVGVLLRWFLILQTRHGTKLETCPLVCFEYFLQQSIARVGALKMREWKKRQWKYRHERTRKCRWWKCRSGNIGTILQGWKMEWKHRHDFAGVENAGVETSARSCRGGKCGSWSYQTATTTRSYKLILSVV